MLINIKHILKELLEKLKIKLV